VADFYEILGVSKTASAAEVKSAYLKIAREKHPDRFPDPAQKKQAEEFFSRATEAFNTLANEKTRSEYDQELVQPRLTAPAEIAADAHARGLSMLQAKDFHEAVTLLRSAVQHAPEVGRYHADLSRALSANPHWVREAMEELDQAIKIEPRNAGYQAFMARLLQAQGLKLRARRTAEAALGLSPNDAALKQLVAELSADDPPEEEPPKGGGGLFDRLRRKP